MIEDEDKFNFYLNAKFEIVHSLLFSNIIRKPSSKEITELKEKMSFLQIERLYNHIHLSALSAEKDTQVECAIKIWKKWRQFFNHNLKNCKIIIEISDHELETIIYVYQHNI